MCEAGPQSTALPVGTASRNESDQPSTGVVLVEPSFKELEKRRHRGKGEARDSSG